jgi:hypothetical protein
MHDWLSICMDRPKQVFPKFCRDVWFPEKTGLITFVRYYEGTFEGTFKVPSKVPRRLFICKICKMGRFRSTNEGTGTTSASLAPHTVDYLFLGIDAIICSPLINDLFVHPSLPWLSGRFTDCFLALSCPAGIENKGDDLWESPCR